MHGKYRPLNQSAIDIADALVPQAYPQDRNLTPEVTHDIIGNTGF